MEALGDDLPAQRENANELRPTGFFFSEEVQHLLAKSDLCLSTRL
jgi:hypothetical protein